MIFDPVEGVWRGNEKDLKKFMPSVTTISQANDDSIQIPDGMTFDPETMTWQGNDDEVDIFDEIDDLARGSKSFKVEEGEFQMPPDLIASFKVWEEEHKKLGSWLSDGPGDKHDRDHFPEIRTMSIVRIVSQAKRQVVAAAPPLPQPTAPSPPSTAQSHVPHIPVLSPSMSSPGPIRFTRKSVKPGEMDILATSPRGGLIVPETKKKVTVEDWDDVEIPINGAVLVKSSSFVVSDVMHPSVHRRAFYLSFGAKRHSGTSAP